MGKTGAGFAVCPTGPFSSFWPSQGVRELDETERFLRKEKAF